MNFDTDDRGAARQGGPAGDADVEAVCAHKGVVAPRTTHGEFVVEDDGARAEEDERRRGGEGCCCQKSYQQEPPESSSSSVTTLAGGVLFCINDGEGRTRNSGETRRQGVGSCEGCWI